MNKAIDYRYITSPELAQVLKMDGSVGATLSSAVAPAFGACVQRLDIVEF